MTSYLFNIETRTDSEILASLLEYGIGASFDLKAWSLRARDCSSLASVNQRLQLLLEPVRCATAKLITMQALEHDESREHLRDECVYGEINPASFKNAILDRVSLLLPPSHQHPTAANTPNAANAANALDAPEAPEMIYVFCDMI